MNWAYQKLNILDYYKQSTDDHHKVLEDMGKSVKLQRLDVEFNYTFYITFYYSNNHTKVKSDVFIKILCGLTFPLLNLAQPFWEKKTRYFLHHINNQTTNQIKTYTDRFHIYVFALTTTGTYNILRKLAQCWWHSLSGLVAQYKEQEQNALNNAQWPQNDADVIMKAWQLRDN